MSSSSTMSIQRQLQFYFVLTLGFAVLVMGGAWIAYNQVLHKKNAEHVLSVETDMIGNAVRPALMFKDRRLAGEILQSVQFDPDIAVVKLFTIDGKTLFTYRAKEASQSADEQVVFQPTASSAYVHGSMRMYKVVSLKSSPVGVIT